MGIVYVASSPVDMYEKCGLPKDARKVFDDMSDRDVILLNSMIFGYVQNGLNVEAIRCFVNMKMQDVEPARINYC